MDQADYHARCVLGTASHPDCENLTSQVCLCVMGTSAGTEAETGVWAGARNALTSVAIFSRLSLSW